MANLVFISGRKGCGKSTLLRHLVNYHLSAHPDVRFIIFDRTTEWVSRDRVVVLPANHYSIDDAAQFALDHAPSTLVVDEIDLFAPNHLGGLQSGTPLHGIVHYGRHEEVALLCAARRPANAHIDIRALADVVFFFRTTEPRDLQWIAKLCGEEWATAASQVPKFQFVRYEG